MGNASYNLPDTIREIDTRLEYLFGEISALQTKRNGLVPFFQLPNEVISQILAFYAGVSGISSFSLTWTKIMLVCRRFYEVAKAEHALWSYVDASDLSAKAHTSLRRQISNAGVCPLTMTMTVYRGSVFGAWVTSEYADRIVSLEVTGQSTHVYELIKSFVEHPLSMLRRLKLNHFREQELPEGVFMAFPDALLDGKLPCLRQLSLSKMSVSWSLLRDLETLSLSECADSSLTAEDMPNVGHVLRLIAASPDLHYLSLTPGDPVEPFIDIDNGPMSLPKLGYFLYHDQVEPSTVLFKALRLSPTATVELLPFGVVAGANIRDLLVPVRAYLRQATSPQRHAIVLSIHRNDEEVSASFLCTMVLLASDDTPHPHPLDSEREFTSRLTVNSHPRNEPSLRQIVTKFIHATRVDLLTHFDASAVRNISAASWRTLFLLLPALDSLRLTASEFRKEDDSMVVALTALCALVPTTLISTLYIRVLRTWRPLSQLDLQGEWVGPAARALYAYVRCRRKHWNAYAATSTSAPSPLALVDIDDQRSFLWSSLHRRLMERIWRKMDGMGVVKRDGNVWDPVEIRKRARQARAEMREEMVALGIELPDGTGTDDSEVATGSDDSDED
ncbi:F-box domain-containing protein [Mycena chlorophos]|uniref:F-box domain-containing protein n=1 Tax=Mycena chlorophos TaxID=658473 RepID=A0A8H6TH81_MYCCL|nr:F-box domain-containing protein [Mycena chlorophos]